MHPLPSNMMNPSALAAHTEGALCPLVSTFSPPFFSHMLTLYALPPDTTRLCLPLVA